MNAVPTENLGGIFDKDTEGNNSPVVDFNPQLIARQEVCTWAQHALGVDIKLDDVYVVWFAKTLQNWKALVSTTARDGRYYEVTFNGDKKELYLDTYKKTHNVAVPYDA